MCAGIGLGWPLGVCVSAGEAGGYAWCAIVFGGGG